MQTRVIYRQDGCVGVRSRNRPWTSARRFERIRQPVGAKVVFVVRVGNFNVDEPFGFGTGRHLLPARGVGCLEPFEGVSVDLDSCVTGDGV